MEDKENDNKPQQTQNAKNILVVPEPEKKDTARKPRRSVLKEFDPLATDSPCIPKNQPPPQVTIREEEHFEDAETSIKLIGTPLKGAHDLLVLESEGRLSPNPADVSDLEYVEAYDSLSSHPEDQLAREEDISINIPTTVEQTNILDVSTNTKNTTLDLKNEKSVVKNVEGPLNSPLNSTFGLSAALERLKIMGTPNGSTNSDFDVPLRIGNDSFSSNTEEKDVMNNTVGKTGVNNVNSTEDQSERDENTPDEIKNTSVSLKQIFDAEEQFENKASNASSDAEENRGNLVETSEIIPGSTMKDENVDRVEVMNNTSVNLKQIFDAEEQFENKALNASPDAKENRGNSVETSEIIPGNTMEDENVDKVEIQEVENDAETLNYLPRIEIMDDDEAIRSMVSSFSKTLDFEESVLIEHSDHSKSDISNDSRGTLNQTVDRTIELSDTEHAAGSGSTQLKDIGKNNDVEPKKLPLKNVDITDLDITEALNVPTHVESPVNEVEGANLNDTKVLDVTPHVESTGGNSSGNDGNAVNSNNTNVLNTTINIESPVMRVDGETDVLNATMDEDGPVMKDNDAEPEKLPLKDVDITDSDITEALNVTNYVASHVNGVQGANLNETEVLDVTTNVGSPVIKTIVSCSRNSSGNDVNAADSTITTVLNTTTNIESPVMRVDDVDSPPNDVKNTNETLNGTTNSGRPVQQVDNVVAEAACPNDAKSINLNETNAMDEVSPVMKDSDVEPEKLPLTDVDITNSDTSGALNVTTNVESPVNEVQGANLNETKVLDVTTNVDSPVIKTIASYSRNSSGNDENAVASNNATGLNTTTNIESPVRRADDVGLKNSPLNDAENTNEALNVTTNSGRSLQKVDNVVAEVACRNDAKSIDLNETDALNTAIDEGSPVMEDNDAEPEKLPLTDVVMTNLDTSGALNVTTNVESPINEVKGANLNETKVLDVTTNVDSPVIKTIASCSRNSSGNDGNAADSNTTTVLNTTTNIDSPVMRVDDVGLKNAPLNDAENMKDATNSGRHVQEVDNVVAEVTCSNDAKSINFNETDTLNNTAMDEGSPVMKDSDGEPEKLPLKDVDNTDSDTSEALSVTTNVERPINEVKGANLNETKVLDVTTNVDSPMIKTIASCSRNSSGNDENAVDSNNTNILNKTMDTERPVMEINDLDFKKSPLDAQTTNGALNITKNVDSPVIEVKNVGPSNSISIDVPGTNLNGSKTLTKLNNRIKSVEENDMMVDSLEGPVFEKKDSIDDMDKQENGTEKMMVDSLEGPITSKRIGVAVQNNTSKSTLRTKSPFKTVSLTRADNRNGNTGLNSSNKTDVDTNANPNEQSVIRVADPELVNKVEDLEHEVETTKRKCNENIQLAQKYKRDVVKYQIVLRDYEKQIVKQDEDLQMLRQENHTIARHFSNLELAFSDVFQKYERTKNVVQKYKENEERLTRAVLSMEEQAKRADADYATANAWIKEECEKMNRKVQATKEKYEQEINSLKTKMKRLEIRCVSTETNLKQKIQECEELAALCDDMTG